MSVITCVVILVMFLKTLFNNFHVINSDAVEVKNNWKTIALYATWMEMLHYTDVIMTTMASQITSLTVVYSTVYSDADQRKHQRSASLAFVRGIHRDRWKCFHLMTSSCEWNRFTACNTNCNQALFWYCFMNFTSDNCAANITQVKFMMTSSNGKVFRVSDHLCGEFTGQWRRALMLSLICTWINVWVNNREAGDLRRYRAHYDVTVMLSTFTCND